MTVFGTLTSALLAAGAIAIGGVLGEEPAGPAKAGPRTAVVIDAAAARDGRDLVDARLRKIDAEIRLPRTPAEAATNVRYFAAQDYRLVVAGPQASAAAQASGVRPLRASGLADALEAAAR
jgi:hypothetical protein